MKENKDKFCFSVSAFYGITVKLQTSIGTFLEKSDRIFKNWNYLEKHGTQKK